jgi:hypothetical protein
MGIIKKDMNNVSDLTAFHIGVINILDEYGYDIADLRYIEELSQLVITIKGMVLFVTLKEITISFEINTTPDIVANLILILAEKIQSSRIHVTDSFIITRNPKGEKIAVFGHDAQELYERDLASEVYDKKYYDILTSSSIKFYEC